VALSLHPVAPLGAFLPSARRDSDGQERHRHGQREGE